MHNSYAEQYKKEKMRKAGLGKNGLDSDLVDTGWGKLNQPHWKRGVERIDSHNSKTKKGLHKL